MSASTRVDKFGLAALVLFSMASVAGYATFGRHPELLGRFPSSADFFPHAFAVFARGHVLVAFAALSASLSIRVGWRWLPGLGVAAGLSLGSELLGTSTGFPFSGYRYTDLLGYQVAGLVPLLIPVSWFTMAFPSYVVACGMATRRWARWGIGALLLTIWDLTLDPAMSSLTRYWVWETPGPYYGMPLVNLAGWFGTGAAIMAGFDWVQADKVVDRIPATLMETYYLVVLSLSLAMTLAGGYWGAAAATAAALASVKGGQRWLAPGTR